jgi:Holliday junction resolvasome RuvABC ATP-dependent DNA helicase subunit
MAWFTKYRPHSFDEMIGHTAVVKSVQALLEKEEVPKSWLFTGQSGIGKTTIARILAQSLGATSSGIAEINAADVRGIDGARAIIKQNAFRSPGSPKTVVIWDECHKLTNEAQNALLKALEEPPAHVFYILCTTEPDKLIETVRQRCIQYKFGPLIPDEVELLLYTIAEKEGVNITPELVTAIIDRSNGSPRLTINMLEKMAPVVGDYVEALQLIEGMAQDLSVEGPTNLGLTVVDMLYGKQKCQWRDLVKLLNDRVLYKKEDIGAFKRSLIFNFGKKLLYTPNSWLAISAQKIEDTLLGANTDGGLIALMYTIWESCPIKQAETTSQRGLNQPTTVGNLPKKPEVKTSRTIL